MRTMLRLTTISWRKLRSSPASRRNRAWCGRRSRRSSSEKARAGWRGSAAPSLGSRLRHGAGRPLRGSSADTSGLGRPFRIGEAALAALLDADLILAHPLSFGELALRNLSRREAVLTALLDLPAVIVATDREVLEFIDRHALFGRGVGYVDAHLLAAARLTAGASYGRTTSGCTASRTPWAWRRSRT